MWAAKNTLAWTDNSDNEDSFLVESKAEDCAASTLIFAQIASVSVNAVTYVDTAVTEGLTYCYRVRASNSVGQSSYSNMAGRTIPVTVPLPPSNPLLP